jgi:hypothetical protein
LWPWNSVYLLITLVTWFFLQPSLSRCVTLKADWIGLVYLRNLGLLWLVSGGWHLLLYTLRWQGKERKYDRVGRGQGPQVLVPRPGAGQYFLELREWLALFGLPTKCFTSGRAPTTGAVCGLARTSHLLRALAVRHPFWQGISLLLDPPCDSLASALQDRSLPAPQERQPGSWSGLAMHPVEHLLYFSVVLIHWVIPSHPIHFLFNSQHTALTPAAGTTDLKDRFSKVEFLRARIFIICITVFSTVTTVKPRWPLDRMFGTFRESLFDKQNSTEARK